MEGGQVVGVGSQHWATHDTLMMLEIFSGKKRVEAIQDIFGIG